VSDPRRMGIRARDESARTRPSRALAAGHEPSACGSGRAGCLRPGVKTGYLGLGSNEGDRLANLRAARDAIRRRGVEVTASSSVYETAPQGEVTDQRDFLNACLRIRTDLDPEALLDVCKRVERELGRAPGGVRHGPRPIDVDLLLLGDLRLRSQRLTMPHPEIGTRRFVLEPLLELDPELRLPGGRPLRELLPAVADQRVTPHAGGSWRHEVERDAARREP
jgi:2-amino-4-hydroxy-6-hydroxymethyldihydropteridine diphosphokinase